MRLNKIIIAPDSFKGTLSSIDACHIIEKGILSVNSNIETIKVPIADGGEGTVEFFLKILGGKKVTVPVIGPSFNTVNASYGILKDGETAVIEMAEASGLSLAKKNENPGNTTTFGTGELILDALNRGCTTLIIGIGGSATNDGGIGMAAALGVKFLDINNKPIPLNGMGLYLLHHIDLSGIDSRLQKCNIQVACDVDNPLYGKDGATYVFAPQKGANEKLVKILDQNLKNYADILNNQLGIDVQLIPGAGAAGGLGAGLAAFMNATLKSGIEIMLDTVNFDELAKDADLIITGEGQIDGQSLRGKVPIGIVKRVKKYNVPVIAVVGAIGDNVEDIYNAGIQSVFSINRKPLDFEIAKKHSKENLFRTIESILRFSNIFE